MKENLEVTLNKETEIGPGVNMHVRDIIIHCIFCVYKLFYTAQNNQGSINVELVKQTMRRKNK